MLNRRAARVLVPGLLLAVAAVSLTGCRTSPNVAAYVGGAQVTTAELESAVEERLADPLVAAFAAGDRDAFTRQVLDGLVQEEVHAAAAERYDVEVTDAEVARRIEVLLAGDDPDTVFDQLAEQGIGREDVVENVRQQMIRQEIALAAGEATEPTDAELQERYAQVREDLAQLRFGYITVPDQATADSVLAQLQAAPDSYPAVAGAYPGAATLPELQERPRDEVRGALAEQLLGLAPGTGFSIVVEEVGGVVVGFLADVVYPPFEELRPQLEQEASEAVSQAGAVLVAEVRDDLDVTLNPRFAPLDDAAVVDVLEDRAS